MGLSGADGGRSRRCRCRSEAFWRAGLHSRPCRLGEAVYGLPPQRVDRFVELDAQVLGFGGHVMGGTPSNSSTWLG